MYHALSLCRSLFTIGIDDSTSQDTRQKIEASFVQAGVRCKQFIVAVLVRRNPHVAISSI